MTVGAGTKHLVEQPGSSQNGERRNRGQQESQTRDSTAIDSIADTCGPTLVQIEWVTEERTWLFVRTVVRPWMADFVPNAERP